MFAGDGALVFTLKHHFPNHPVHGALAGGHWGAAWSQDAGSGSSSLIPATELHYSVLKYI